MPVKWCALLLGLFVLMLAQDTSSTSSNELFTSSFLVRFKRSVDNDVAHEIAKRNSFHNIGPVSELTLSYRLFHPTAVAIRANLYHLHMSFAKISNPSSQIKIAGKSFVIDADVFDHMGEVNSLRYVITSKFLQQSFHLS